VATHDWLTFQIKLYLPSLPSLLLLRDELPAALAVTFCSLKALIMAATLVLTGRYVCTSGLGVSSRRTMRDPEGIDVPAHLGACKTPRWLGGRDRLLAHAICSTRQLPARWGTLHALQAAFERPNLAHCFFSPFRAFISAPGVESDRFLRRCSTS
jgi:hypothetical protein